jgi:hypothetical protein
MNRRRNQFLGDRPLEDAADALDAGVDRLAAPLLFDELLPHGLERQWPELGGRGFAVESPDVADGGFQVPHFVGRVPFLIAVVLLGEVKVRDQHLGHGQSFGIELDASRGRGKFEFEARFRGERLVRTERTWKQLLLP